MRKLIPLFYLLFITYTSFSQSTFPVNGTQHKYHNFYAFTNATIVVSGDHIIENGTLLIKDGKVEKAGKNISLPNSTVSVDLKGKYIYPSFIDLSSDYGISSPKKNNSKKKPQLESAKKGAFNWNQAIHPETRAIDLFSSNEKTASELRSIGFGAVLTHQKDGLARGNSIFTTLSGKKDNLSVLNANVAAHYSFNKGSSNQDYPSSLMGAIALIRQTYYDADWYNRTNEKNEENFSLEAFNSIQNLPQVFEVSDYLRTLRADKIGDEFDVQYIFKTAGDEYKRIKEIKNTNGSFIIPLNFPKVYDISDPYDALHVSLQEMKEWELAPSNPSTLSKNDILFSITVDGTEKKLFLSNLRKAIKYGLSEADAIKALTSNPAQQVGMEKYIGTLEPGKLANFLITSTNIFEKDAIIYENWIRGQKFIINNMNLIDVRGTYDINIDGTIYEVKVSGKKTKPSALLVLNENSKIKAEIQQKGRIISLFFESKDSTKKGTIRLTGNINYDSGSWDGIGQLHDGSWIKWNSIRKEKYSAQKTENQKDSTTLGSITYPLMAYGFDTLPQTKTVIIKNATIWTNEKSGILKNADLLIQDGKISHVGEILDVADDAIVIDATGKHVTAGIIDEHTHIATTSVNEMAQSSTAEVRIGDVINPDDINIYRQLAGGVTAAQVLHGSANAIGGQSGLIKFRWGSAPEEMKIKNADGFIKFALGENVKQSNWGDHNVVRFPQTRMGVEQVFYDAFIQAKQYEQSWIKYNEDLKKDKNISKPRYNIEMEALVEVLNSKRFITCHSYVQSEINMLMHVADSMGFKINTFTHILEGYKLADQLKKHGAGGSTFSDWWAYKFEVNDAIPYNGPIMHNQGIVVAYNSDDPEMGRRLNQEAAKAVKYGGVSEENAWKFVTLNPAKLLHLDDRMGSIKAGKDADIVIWSDNPLSIYAKVEKTFVDGSCYFDIEKDKQMRAEIQKERNRLINKMHTSLRNGEPKQEPKKKTKREFHCDSIGDQL